MWVWVTLSGTVGETNDEGEPSGDLSVISLVPAEGTSQAIVADDENGERQGHNEEPRC